MRVITFVIQFHNEKNLFNNSVTSQLHSSHSLFRTGRFVIKFIFFFIFLFYYCILLFGLTTRMRWYFSLPSFCSGNHAWTNERVSALSYFFFFYIFAIMQMDFYQTNYIYFRYWLHFNWETLDSVIKSQRIWAFRKLD